MMTVRYPNGQAIQYNDAMFLEHGNGTTWVLRKKQGGDPLAFIQASAGAIVEFVYPCRVYDGIRKIEDEKVAEITREIRSVKRKLNSRTVTKRETT